ncbi:TauD/TfdA family dioxygenase [Ramlibacter sp. AW1]|uniref:TauD/TfdA family dioxygenase n=1 Tax=Ramlibacter aurantiacus TaxID=2801330 RepID=A0A937D0V4_9BURK|nr:TauD/TfdA family dioxygenase [Ramlibacter aurantiacus]MBL0419854.1 TauD/TfdA family dioxygenase [Ramlibacter aurantiacus]
MSPATLCATPVEHPAAWTSARLGGRQAITRRLMGEELAGLDRLLARTAHLPPQGATRADFDEPAVNRLMDEVRAILTEGRGVVLLAGIDTDRYAPEAMERIYWGMGTHLGTAAVQSRGGDRLGRVEQDDQDPVQRGYRSSSELRMHTDSYELIGLMCIRQAARGGQSALVSSLAIHNVLLRERPELLAPLYRGFPMAIPEARHSARPITDTAIPVFCCVDGVVSCNYAGSFMRAAAQQLGQALPPELDEALRVFSEIAERDELALRFMLEPGEILLWNNFTNLHSRTEFENDDGHRRLLLRLWLHAGQPRPTVPQLHERARVYDRVYQEHAKEVHP